MCVISQPEHIDLSTIVERGELKVLKQLYKTNPERYQLNQESICHLFECSAKYGHLDVLKWLKKQFSLTRTNLLEEDFFVLKIAVVHNQPDIIRWFKKSFGLSDDDGRCDDNWLLRRASQWGTLELVKCIVETFSLSEVDINMDQNCSPFANALMSENISILDYFVDTFSMKLDHHFDHVLLLLKWAFFGKTSNSVVWLKTKFSLNSEHARGDNNRLLRYFAENGDMERLQSLHCIFGLVREDAISEDNFALFIASEKGFGSVLSCLHESYGLTSDDARQSHCYPLRISAENGHVENMKILKVCYGLTGSDARIENNYALRNAANNGHINVLEVLKSDYDLFTEDALASNNESAKVAISQGNSDVLKALKEVFLVPVTKNMERALENVKDVSLNKPRTGVIIDDALLYIHEMPMLGMKPYIKAFFSQEEKTFQSLEDTLLEMSQTEENSIPTSIAFWNMLIKSYKNAKKKDLLGRFCMKSFDTLLALETKMLVFDLHGLRLKSAKTFTVFILAYLENRVALCQYNKVELIVGKGLHSKNKVPVLADQLPLMLRSLNINHVSDDGNIVVPLNHLDDASWSFLDSEEFLLHSKTVARANRGSWLWCTNGDYDV